MLKKKQQLEMKFVLKSQSLNKNLNEMTIILNVASEQKR